MHHAKFSIVSFFIKQYANKTVILMLFIVLNVQIQTLHGKKKKLIL